MNFISAIIFGSLLVSTSSFGASGESKIHSLDESSVRSLIRFNSSSTEVKKNKSVLQMKSLDELNKSVLKYRQKIESGKLKSSGGGMDGAGGDGQALEFLKIAQELKGQLSSQEITSSFAEVFGMAISATEIEFVQHSLSLNSIRKDAINYASLQKIIVDGLSWKNLSYYQQVALVIHEYLGVMGINDQRGQYSNYFFRMALNLNSSYANLTGQPGTEIFVYDQLVSTLQQLTDKEEKRTLITSILKVFFAFDKVTFQNPNSETELRLAETIATGAKFYLSFDPTTQSFINLKGERLRTQSEQDQSSVIYAVRRAIIFDSDLMATTFTENWQNQTCNLNIGGNLRISKTVEKMGLYMVLLKQCNGMWAPMPETNYIKTLDE